jgi:hypothetical protein
VSLCLCQCTGLQRGRFQDAAGLQDTRAEQRDFTSVAATIALSGSRAHSSSIACDAASDLSHLPAPPLLCSSLSAMSIALPDPYNQYSMDTVQQQQQQQQLATVEMQQYGYSQSPTPSIPARPVPAQPQYAPVQYGQMPVRSVLYGQPQPQEAYAAQFTAPGPAGPLGVQAPQVCYPAVQAFSPQSAAYAASATVLTVTGDSCAAGGPHSYTESYPALAWILAILFFPMGVFCCLAMREDRCVKCDSLPAPQRGRSGYFRGRWLALWIVIAVCIAVIIIAVSVTAAADAAASDTCDDGYYDDC